jgi:alcohol dehydrogenase
LPQKCQASVKYGHEQIQPGYELRGGLAEHCLLAPGTAIVRLPHDLPLSVACPASCATATIAAALAAAGELREMNVCLFGAGLLGLTACAMLRVAGAANIVCVDLDDSRRRRALDFGATIAVPPDELDDVSAEVTNDFGFDVILELSGSNAAFDSGLNVVRIGGTLVLVGAVFPTAPVSIAPERIVRRNLSIHGIHNYRPADLLRAVEFLSQHHTEFPFAEVVCDWLPLDSAGEAFRLSHDPNRIRVGVGPVS